MLHLYTYIDWVPISHVPETPSEVWDVYVGVCVCGSFLGVGWWPRSFRWHTATTNATQTIWGASMWPNGLSAKVRYCYVLSRILPRFQKGGGRREPASKKKKYDPSRET